MKKEELLKRINKSVDEQREIIENTNSVSFAAREILGSDSTLARNIIKEICIKNGWKIPVWYNRVRYCVNCGKEIIGGDSKKKFCSHSCSATYNNIKRGKTKYFCLNCGKELKRGKFCNNTCYAKYYEKQYVERWKNGEETGLSGKYGIKNAVRNYIFNKNNNKCENCGTNLVNPYTNNSILQIHHIDGDCTNNKEENLKLLCPNCHAMTENFGSRNKKATRKDNRKRY